MTLEDIEILILGQQVVFVRTIDLIVFAIGLAFEHTGLYHYILLVVDD